MGIKEQQLSKREMKALLLYIDREMVNLSACMIEVGWSKGAARTAATNLLKTKKAKDFIQGRINKVLEKYRWKADDVLNEIALIAMSDIAYYFIKTENGLILKDIHELGPERRAIKKIKHTKTITGEGDKKTVTNNYEFELWSKEKMLQILAQYHNLLGENPEGDKSQIPAAIVYVPDDGRNK